MPVRSSPSIEMSMKDGMQIRSRPPAATYPRDIAIALTAWLMAPAPMAWTSTRLWVRTTPAMAPATATGLEVAETLRISMAGRPERTVLGAAGATGVPWLPGGGDASVDPFDEGGVSRVCIYSNQYGIERDDAFGHLKPMGQARQEALQADLTVHPDHGVPRPHHPQVGDEGCAVGQNPSIRGRDVGVGPEYEAGPAVQVPAHGDLLGGGLGMDVDQPEPGAAGRRQHLVHGPKGRVGGRHEKLALDVAHQDLALGPEVMAVPAASGSPGRVVLGPQDGPAVEAGQHLPLVPDVVARGQHVDPQGEEVVGDLGGQAEAAGRVLPVGHHQVHAVLLAKLGQEAGDGVASRTADDVPDGEHGHDHWRMVAR